VSTEGRFHIPFSMGLQSVKVWADTTLEAARATAAVERTFENILRVWSKTKAVIGN
jgi:hypothetical protein